MASLRSLSFFILISALPSFASALTADQTAALDRLLAQRKSAFSNSTSGADQLKKQIDLLEQRMLPIVFTFNRLGPVVGQRLAELDQLNVYLQDPKNILNPYEDQNWVEQTRKETAYVCCDVRRSPRLAQEIQENLAQGLPALSSNTSDAVAERARRAVKGGPIHGDALDETSKGESAPASRDSNSGPLPTLPKKSGASSGVRAGGGSGSGIISGLPVPPTPAPTPAAPAANGQIPAAPAAGNLTTPASPPAGTSTVAPAATSLPTSVPAEVPQDPPAPSQ